MLVCIHWFIFHSVGEYLQQYFLLFQIPLIISFQSRAALSVLAYCYYQMQDFVNASDCYEQLASLHPEVEEYRLYYAQSLYKACLFQEAMKVTCQIDQPHYQGQVSKIINPLFRIRYYCNSFTRTKFESKKKI